MNFKIKPNSHVVVGVTNRNNEIRYTKIPEENLKFWTPKPITRMFNSDFNAMKWADTCVLVLPCGRSAHTEAGWMKGAGKKVLVYQIWAEEPELMYKIYDDIITTGKELLASLD